MIPNEGIDFKGRKYKRRDLGNVRKDLTKENFEHFTVLFRIDSDSSATYYLCQCECGNLFCAKGTHLTNKSIISCGCVGKRHENQSRKIDLTGQTFGLLTVLNEVKRNNMLFWHCKCNCGNFVDVKADNLKSGNTKSCGCLKRKIQNLSGNKYGKWSVLNNYQRIKNKTYWECKCDCGTVKYVRADELTAGVSYSCGCEKQSKGVRKIINLLNLNNIKYKTEVTFSDLLSPRHQLLRYDFVIYSNNKPIRIIEYDGELHYNAVERYGGIQELKYRRQCDEIKNLYAISNNIPLIRIPYYDLDKFSYEDLFSNKYLIS